MSRNELLTGLNAALNREVTTFLRYMVQSSIIKGAQWEPVRSLYRKEVHDEVGHAQFLMDAMVMLGGTPKLAPDLSPPPTDVREMLRRDIEKEETDISQYIALSRLADTENMISLKLRLEEQAADESDHAQEMKRLLG